MAAITTRQTAGTGASAGSTTVNPGPLSNTQLDTNFINLNNDVLSRLSLTGGTITGNLTITGSVSASTKSFLIDHPTKPGMKLRHGSLEGPEHGVYVRGRLAGGVIQLPDYWSVLVDESSITVNLTPIGKHQKLYVEKVENNCVYVANSEIFGGVPDCFYTINGERKDIDKMQVEC